MRTCHVSEENWFWEIEFFGVVQWEMLVNFTWICSWLLRFHVKWVKTIFSFICFWVGSFVWREKLFFDFMLFAFWIKKENFKTFFQFNLEKFRNPWIQLELKIAKTERFTRINSDTAMNLVASLPFPCNFKFSSLSHYNHHQSLLPSSSSNTMDALKKNNKLQVVSFP